MSKRQPRAFVPSKYVKNAAPRKRVEASVWDAKKEDYVKVVRWVLAEPLKVWAKRTVKSDQASEHLKRACRQWLLNKGLSVN